VNDDDARELALAAGLYQVRCIDCRRLLEAYSRRFEDWSPPGGWRCKLNERQALRAYAKIMAEYRRTGKLPRRQVMRVKDVRCADGTVCEIAVPMGAWGERFPSWQK
jgi:hypothetical protein